MKVERDTAGLALPFAAGTATAVYGDNLFTGNEFIWTSLVFMLMISASCLLLKTAGSADKDISHILTAITGAAAGFLCAMAAQMYSTGCAYGRSWIEEEAGGAISKAIDRIPFSGSTTIAIIKALITGNRDSIPKSVTDAFRDSGASHILALSGLHLAMIYGIVTKVSAIFGNSPFARKARAYAAVMICGLYTAATGAGASVVRAFIFILLGEAASMTGRHRSTGSILWASLTIQLAISPLSIESVGFQLSYAAMYGIAFIYPRLRDIWPQEGNFAMRILKRIWNSAAISIACQITTGPIAFAYFGTLPEYFLLTNLLAVPLAGVIIPAALLTLLLETFGICPETLIRATEQLVYLLISALENISTM